MARPDWAQWSTPVLAALRIVLIVVAAWIAIAVLQRLVRGVRVRIQARLHGVESARRAETLCRVIRYLVALVITAMAIMLVLAAVGS